MEDLAWLYLLYTASRTRSSLLGIQNDSLTYRRGSGIQCRTSFRTLEHTDLTLSGSSGMPCTGELWEGVFVRHMGHM